MKTAVLILLIALIAMFAGCVSEEENIDIYETETEIPSAVPTQIATTQIELTPDETATAIEEEKEPVWKADGIIGEDEYENVLECSRDLFYIYWTSDKEYLYMAMRGKTTGWISIGFNPTVSMDDADIILGGVQGNSGNDVYIYDMYSIGAFGPHPPDTELGGYFDIDEYAASEESAYTNVEFSRKLDTGDEYDSTLEKGESAKVLWSLSYQDTIELKHNAGKGGVEITI